MSVQWDAYDERQRGIKQQEVALKAYLKSQSEDSKQRKVMEKRMEIDEYRKITAIPPIATMAANTVAFKPLIKEIVANMSPVQTKVYLNDYTPLDTLAYPQSMNEHVLKLKLNGGNVTSSSNSWMESEIQNNKVVIQSLTNRIDRLAEKSLTDEMQIRELVGKLQYSEQTLVMIQQNLHTTSTKVNDGMRLQGVVIDVISKQTQIENECRDQGEKGRFLVDQLNQMRMKMETYMIKTDQVGSELSLKNKDWINESQAEAKTNNIIQSHDIALNTLQRVIDSSIEALMRKMDQSHLETFRRFENESKARLQLESSMKDMCGEWRNIIQNQERSLNDKIDSGRRVFENAIVNEDAQIAKISQGFMNECRSIQGQIAESKDKIQSVFQVQIQAFDNNLNDFQAQTTQNENKLRISVDEKLLRNQELMVKKITECIDVNQENRKNLSHVAKALQESIMVAEKSNETRIKSVEDVLRAEIKARLESESKTRAFLESFAHKMIDYEKKNDIVSKKDHEDMNARLEDFVQYFKSELIAAGELSLQTTKISQEGLDALREKMELYELQFQESFDKSSILMGIIKGETNEKIDTLKNDLDNEISNSFVQKDENATRLQNLQTQFTEKLQNLEQKFNGHETDIDSQIKTLKSEIRAFATKSEIENLNEALEERIVSNIDEIDLKILSIREDSAKYLSKVESSRLQICVQETLKDIEQRTTTNEIKINILETNPVTQVESNCSEELQDRLESFVAENKRRQVEIEANFDHFRTEFENNEIMRSESAEKMQATEEKIQKTLDGLTTSQAKTNASMLDKVAINSFKDYQNRNQIQIDKNNAIIHELKSTLIETQDNVRQILTDIDNNDSKSLEEHQRIKTRLDKSSSDIERKIGIVQESSRKLEEVYHELSAAQLKHESKIERVHVELIDRSKMFNEKVCEVFAGIEQISDSRDDYREDIQNQLDSFTDKFRDVTAELLLKLDHSDSEKLSLQIQTNFQSMTDNIATKSSQMDHLQQQINEQEADTKDRLRALGLVSDRLSKEQVHSIKSIKDLISRRIESVENRIKASPNASESCVADIKALRDQMSNTIQRSLAKHETEITSLQADLKVTVNQRSLDTRVEVLIAPLISNIHSLEDAIEDLKENKILTRAASQSIQGNFYKPEVRPVSEKKKLGHPGLQHDSRSSFNGVPGSQDGDDGSRNFNDIEII